MIEGKIEEGIGNVEEMEEKIMEYEIVKGVEIERV